MIEKMFLLRWEILKKSYSIIQNKQEVCERYLTPTSTACIGTNLDLSLMFSRCKCILHKELYRPSQYLRIQDMKEDNSSGKRSHFVCLNSYLFPPSFTLAVFSSASLEGTVCWWWLWPEKLYVKFPCQACLSDTVPTLRLRQTGNYNIIQGHLVM